MSAPDTAHNNGPDNQSQPEAPLDAPHNPTKAVEQTRPSTIKITHQEERSIMTVALQKIIAPLRPHVAKPGKAMPKGSNQLDIPSKIQKDCDVKERQVEGIWVYDITSQSNAKSQPEHNDGISKRRICYFAGGGWQMPPSSQHWNLVRAMATRIPGSTISLISYPLAPNSPAHTSLPQLKQLYYALLEESAAQSQRLILAGDSAGGNVAICLALWALTESAHSNPDTTAAGVDVPVAVMGICPSTDLRHEHEDLEGVSKDDPLLTKEFVDSTAKAWCDGKVSSRKDTNSLLQKGEYAGGTLPGVDDIAWGPDDYRVSPVLGDLSLFRKYGVKVHGVTGNMDVLGIEAVIFRDKLGEAGVEGEWLEWDGQMHCFPLAFSYGLKESKMATDWMFDVLKRC